MGLDYVDCYLIHHPAVAAGNLDSVWRTMEQIKEDGLAKYIFGYSDRSLGWFTDKLCRSIGVSNFMISDLMELLSFARIKPAVNQVLSCRSIARLKD